MIYKHDMRAALSASVKNYPSGIYPQITAFTLIRRAMIMAKQANINPVWLANALHEELVDRKLILNKPPSW